MGVGRFVPVTSVMLGWRKALARKLRVSQIFLLNLCSWLHTVWDEELFQMICGFLTEIFSLLLLSLYIHRVRKIEDSYFVILWTSLPSPFLNFWCQYMILLKWLKLEIFPFCFIKIINDIIICQNWLSMKKILIIFSNLSGQIYYFCPLSLVVPFTNLAKLTLIPFHLWCFILRWLPIFYIRILSYF